MPPPQSRRVVELLQHGLQVHGPHSQDLRAGVSKGSQPDAPHLLGRGGPVGEALHLVGLDLLRLHLDVLGQAVAAVVEHVTVLVLAHLAVEANIALRKGASDKATQS